MKFLLLASLLITSSAFAGKLQNEDSKSVAELVGAGSNASHLLNTSKIWDDQNGQVLDTTIASVTHSVTSVSASVPAFLSVGGVPITSAGTIAISYSGTALPVANGGTNSTAALNNNRIMTSVGGAIVEASAITASRALVSDGSGLPAASAVTATELGYVSGVTGSIQAQLNAKANLLSVPNSQMVYVSQLVGINAAGCGTYGNPCNSIVYALTQITDSSQTKPYVIKMLADRQLETSDILLKPYVSIVGQGQRATYMKVTGGTIKPDSSMSAQSWNYLGDFYLGGSTGINWDLQSVGGSNNVLVIENMTLTGTITLKGRNAGGGDYVEMYNGLILGNLNLDSMLEQIMNIEIGTPVTITNTQGITQSGNIGTFDNVIFDSGITITSHSVNLNNAAYTAGSGITTLSAVTINAFHGLPSKSLRAWFAGTTVNDLVDATATLYSPAVPGNYSPAVTDVSAALDQLAAKTLPVPAQEVPAGAIGGNVTFTLAHTPTSAAAVHLRLDGLGLRQGGGNDYTISGATITMAVAPVAGQTIDADYQY